MIAAKMAGRRHERPEVRKVPIRFTAGSAFVFGFLSDVGDFFGSERPASPLWVAGSVGIIESGTG